MAAFASRPSFEGSTAGLSLPKPAKVEKKRVECLACGSRRSVAGATHHVDAGECQKCGYVGWALVEDLTDVARRMLRERPVERRRLRIV